MSIPIRSNFFRITLLGTILVAVFVLHHVNRVRAAGGPIEPLHSSYRVLAPIVSGNLLLFPVVESGKMPA